MAPHISFEGAHGFKVSGGNFGKVRGNVETINVNDVQSPSWVLKYLTTENRDRQRLSSDPRPRRDSHPPVSSTTNSSTFSDSSDSESSDSEGFGTDSMHSDYSTPLSSLDDLHQSLVNSLGLNGVPPPQSQFQPLRAPHGMPNIGSPRFPQVQPGRAESRASPPPAYSARVRNPLQSPQNTTPVPPRSANMESRRHPSSYPQPPTSAHTTPRAHHPPPFSRPDDTMAVSPHRTNHATPRLRNLSTALPRSITVTPVLVSTPQHQSVPHSQSASSRIHSRPLPHIPGTSSAFPPPTRASSVNVAPSLAIPPQASSSSANAMRDVRTDGGYNSNSIAGGDVRVNSTIISPTQTPISSYGYHDHRGCRSPHLYPHGQYTAAPILPFAPFYPQYDDPHIARADIPWSRGAPQLQRPQQNQHGYQHGYQHGGPVPYAVHSPRTGGSSGRTPTLRGF